MHAWNMPMFFLLSGISAYYALHRRSRAEFHLERYHRLLIPCLAIMAVTQLPFLSVYAAKLEGWCLWFREGKIPEQISSWCKMFMPIYPQDTAATFLQKLWKAPSPHQGWFLAYLFFYSQILGTAFYYWHPSSSGNEPRWRGLKCL